MEEVFVIQWSPSMNSTLKKYLITSALSKACRLTHIFLLLAYLIFILLTLVFFTYILFGFSIVWYLWSGRSNWYEPISPQWSTKYFWLRFWYRKIHVKYLVPLSLKTEFLLITGLLIKAWQVCWITNVILNMCSHMSWQFPNKTVCSHLQQKQILWGFGFAN